MSEHQGQVDDAVPASERDGSSPEYGDVWVYESFLEAIPGVSLSKQAAITIQVGLFGLGVVVLGLLYDIEHAILPGLVAVAVAGVGSLAMLRFGQGTRRLDPPPAYRQLLFGSSIEVVLGVLAFVALVVYLFVVDPAMYGTSLLTALLGDPLPPVPTFLTLLVLWDLCYRIGTFWWAAVAALWRARWASIDPSMLRAYHRLDALNVGFAAVQLVLVPFVLSRPVLVAALCGHVVAVTVVEIAAVVLQRE